MPGTVVAVEGGLLPPDLLDRIAAGDAEGQDAAAFGLNGNRRLIDEVQRAFSDARAEWDAFQVRLGRSRESATTLTRQYWATPFLEILGFPSLRTQRGHIEAGGQRYDISHIAGEADDAPPVHIVACGQALDARVGRRSPHNSVQEYLNRSDAAWGLVTNGEQLRLLRDSERFTRPTYVEFDLRGIFDGNQYAEFALAYRLLHRTRFPASGAEVADSWLEKYFHLGIDEGGRVRERLRDGVEVALRSLGQGMVAHSRSQALREALEAGRLDVADYHRQLLRLVYRLLFLMVAEERRLIFSEDGVSDDRTEAYLRYYSLAALRDRCERHFLGDDHHDLWLGLLQTFRLFRSPGAAESLGLAPVDGELFGERACSDLERAACSNEALLRAMLNLSTFLDDEVGGVRRRGRRRGNRGVRRRVNYAALDVEELGSVYEALLDLQPRIEPPAREGGYPTFDLVAGSERKQTGSYYTPPDLVNELVGSALVPVIEDRLAEAGTREDRERALLGLRVVDPASGSGHFLLAAARRIAIDLAQVRAGDDGYSPTEFREAQRDVIRHCIYAVDKNPLAVDLCKVALWIESHTPGLPLSFLDHHVKCGDSLVGVGDLDHLHAGIPDGAYRAIGGDDKAAATSYRKRNRVERRGQLGFGSDPTGPAAWADDFETFAGLDERSPAEVQAKEELYAQLRGDGTLWWNYKTTCDLWTYAFFAPLQPTGIDGLDGVPTTNDLRDSLAGSTSLAKLIGAAAKAAQTQRFFHWPLEFPDIFEPGGFDVVLGNPPWDRYRLAEREFFAARDPEIASASRASDRKRMISALAELKPALHSEYRRALRLAEGQPKFARESGRYQKGAVGQIDLYQLFAELAPSFLNATGRSGMILKTGIATDKNTRALFSGFMDDHVLVSLLDFENREKIFLGIDSRIKFCLLTLAGQERPVDVAEFACYLHRTEQLDEPDRRFTLTANDFALFNPNTRNCPMFRTRRDAALTRYIYERVPVFVNEAQPRTGQDRTGQDRTGQDRTGQDRLTTNRPNGLSHSSRSSICRTTPLISWPVLERQLSTGRLQYEQRLTLLCRLFKVGFLRVLDMSTDSAIFREAPRPGLVPVYESKLIHQFDHRWATFVDGNARELTDAEKETPDASIRARWWVPQHEVEARIGGRWSRDWLLCWRDFTNSTNERTAIASVIPRVAVGNTAPIIFACDESPSTVAALCANLNSFVLDYVARQKVGGTHLNYFIIKQLPILRPDTYDAPATWQPSQTLRDWIAARVLELSYTAWDLQAFAHDLGYNGPPFRWDTERRFELRCELDSAFFTLYGINRDEVEYIISTFPIVERRETRAHGSYRSRDRILELYDAMLSGRWRSALDPPAADPRAAHEIP